MKQAKQSKKVKACFTASQTRKLIRNTLRSTKGRTAVKMLADISKPMNTHITITFAKQITFKAMKKKFVLIALTVFMVINTRIVFCPEFDHYVIGSRLFDISIVHHGGEFTAIWINGKLFSKATQFELDNI